MSTEHLDILENGLYTRDAVDGFKDHPFHWQYLFPRFQYDDLWSFLSIFWLLQLFFHQHLVSKTSLVSITIGFRVQTSLLRSRQTYLSNGRHIWESYKHLTLDRDETSFVEEWDLIFLDALHPSTLPPLPSSPLQFLPAYVTPIMLELHQCFAPLLGDFNVWL